MKKISISYAFLLAFFAIGASAVYAEDTVGSADRYFPDFQNDIDMPAVESPKSFSKRGIQYGGWLTPIFIDQRSSERSLSSMMVNARLWAKANLWDNSFVYVRVKDMFLGVMHQDGYSVATAENVVDLDVGFIEISNRNHSLTLTAGRKFFLLGTGLVLDGRGDGLQFNFRTPYVSGYIFGAWTGYLLKDDNPYEMSDRDFSVGARRIFAGGSFSFDFYNQTLYLFSVGQVDLGQQYTDEKSRYNSIYYGLGMNGILFTGLFYYAEFVYEMGKSVVAGENRLSDISAFAGVFGVYYYFNTILNPVLILQYGFGSGDSGRNNYRSPNGNSDGNDTGFIYFGRFQGGYALKPLLGNIHVIRVGYAISPFDWTDMNFIKQLTLIMKYSYYMKYKQRAGINYASDAMLDERDIGHGFDVSLRWRIFYDLSAFINYGLFVPGKAYDSSEPCRNFYMMGVTMVF